jgi:peptidoglycan L-alanyl-D-glutamate endopeptidase CwlK
MLLKRYRLKGVHMDLQRIVREAAKLLPFDVIVLEGVRDLARQKKLVARGASKTLKSRHLIGKDGKGHAVDLAPVVDTDGDGDKEVSWAWPDYYTMAPIIKRVAKKHGIRIGWGGDWRTFKDGPHFQLPKSKYP